MGVANLYGRLRTVALLLCGSLLVHELRYAVGYGSTFNQALATQGHSYLPWFEAVSGLILSMALARFAMQLLHARRGRAVHDHHASFLRLWAHFWPALAAVYLAQEGIEGAFSPGHPAGMVGVFGNGGWTALLFAAVIGAVIAFLSRGAEIAVEMLLRRASRRPEHGTTRSAIPRSDFFPLLDAIALHRAGRGPPLRS